MSSKARPEARAASGTLGHGNTPLERACVAKSARRSCFDKLSTSGRACIKSPFEGGKGDVYAI
jgi:hypothetical protein